MSYPPCPIHGTKPEAPTELCKVCGDPEKHWLHEPDYRGLNGGHAFTPKDATPKDEETGR